MSILAAADAVESEIKTLGPNAPILDEALHDIDELEAGRRIDISVEHTWPEIFAIFQPAVQGFLLDLLSYDPPAVLARYQGPVLILQGEPDVQIGTDDARRLAAAAPRATLTLLPGVNHILKVIGSDDRAANLKTYFDPKLPLASGMVEAVVDFINTAKSK